MRCFLLLLAAPLLSHALSDPAQLKLAAQADLAPMQRPHVQKLLGHDYIEGQGLLKTGSKQTPTTGEHEHLPLGQSEIEDHELLETEVKQTPSKVEYKNWFSRLGSAIWSVVVGFFIVIPFSMSFLYINEQRNARQESLISLGESEAKSITSTSAADAEENGVLVHMDSGDAQGLEPLVDDRFPQMTMNKGCLRMKSTVQAYQWEEYTTTETRKDAVGGGETTITHYHYRNGWYETNIDSSQFNHEKRGDHQNFIRVEGLQLGTKTKNNPTVKYGEHHYLPEKLVEMLDNWSDASKVMGDSFQLKAHKFQKVGDWFYCAENGHKTPKIGDVRVSFNYVLDGPATVLALQADDKDHPGSATFLPYRSVARGICGSVGDEELRKRLVTQGKKSGMELYDDDKCDFGPFYCLCLCCNLVACCFANVVPPQIFAAFPGRRSKYDAFGFVKTQSMAMKWGFRILGWLLLYIGTYMLFDPLLVILDIVPFLGPYISGGVSVVVCMVVLLFTAIEASFLVAVAYLRFHPLQGALYLAGLVAIVGATIALARTL